MASTTDSIYDLNVVILDVLEEGDYCLFLENEKQFYPKEPVIRFNKEDCKKCIYRFRCLTGADDPAFTIEHLCRLAKEFAGRPHDPTLNTLVVSKNVYASIAGYFQENHK